MQLDAAGFAFIKSNEGCVLHTYLDEARVLSLAWGHVVKPTERWWNGGQPSTAMTCTQAEADAMFLDELRFYCAGVAQHVHVPLTQSQYTALVDFAYNEGVGALAGSTVLRLLNAGDYASAAAHLTDWDKLMKDGKLVVSQGLLSRRMREQALFLRDVA